MTGRNPKRKKHKINKATPPKDSTVWSKSLSFLKKGYVIGGVIFTILGWIAFKDQFHKWFSSERTLFEEEKFIRGILIPDRYFSETKSLKIKMGTLDFQRDISEFKEGVEFSQGTFGCADSGEDPLNMRFIIINDRLHISTTLIDYPNEEAVGVLERNRWKLAKSNLFTYKDTDQFLEVIDRQGNVLFSLRFEAPNTLIYRGYVVGTKFISVATQNNYAACYPKDDPVKMMKIKELIKSISPVIEDSLFN